jgi:hypothetical protein
MEKSKEKGTHQKGDGKVDDHECGVRPLRPPSYGFLLIGDFKSALIRFDYNNSAIDKINILAQSTTC